MQCVALGSAAREDRKVKSEVKLKKEKHICLNYFEHIVGKNVSFLKG